MPGWLTAYWLKKEMGEFPPGRRDPQVLEAIAVIDSEKNAIEREQLEQR